MNIQFLVQLETPHIAPFSVSVYCNTISKTRLFKYYENFTTQLIVAFAGKSSNREATQTHGGLELHDHKALINSWLARCQDHTYIC